MTQGCGSSPVSVPPDCGNEAPGEPCVFYDYSVHEETQYLRKVVDNSERDDFFNTVTKAEGGGWGVKVSASVGVMK